MDEKKLTEKNIETKWGKIFYFTNSNYLLDFSSRLKSGKEKLAVLFLHGLAANHATWEKSAKYFGLKGIPCVLAELRGHGLSDKRRKKSLYDFKVFSDDIIQILAQEKIDKVVIVGYSFGGSLAVDFAFRFPEKIAGLVLISANHVNPIKYWRLSWLIIPLAKSGIFLLSWLFIWQKRRRYYYYRPQKAKGYWKSVWQGFKTMPVSVNLWMLLMMGRLNYKNRLKEIMAPALIVHSLHDPFVSQTEVNEMVNGFCHAKEVVSENKNHFLATAAVDEVINIIDKFLAENILIPRQI